MMTISEEKRKISELAFAVYELELYLDTHPYSKRAMELLAEFRTRKQEAIERYEAQHGTLVMTTDDVTPTHHWNWIDSPWPWELEFMED